jgi:lysophospholipase L1-like esterase
MRYLALALALLANSAFAQQPNGTINAPIYATGYISQVGGASVTTKIPAQSNHPTNLNIYTTSAISGTWTIQLPNPAFEGQILSFSCGATVNTISIISTDGSSIDSNLPTTCVGASTFSTQFDQRANIWRNIGYSSSAGILPTQLPAFTGGDCTTTAGSVALSCAKTGGVPFGYFATGSNAANLTGTLSAARLPAFTGDCSTTAGASVISCSGLAAVAKSGSASDITTGTLPLGVIPPSILSGAGTPGSLYATAAAGVDTGLAYTSKVAGSGGTNGTYNVTVTSSGGTNAVVQIVISGGAISGTPSVTTAGTNFTGTKTIANADIVAAGATGLTGASVTLTANGGVSYDSYYWVVSSTPGAALDLYKNVSNVATAQGTSLATGTALNPFFAASSSVNQFDYTKVIEGYEVYYTGSALSPYATSSVSGLMYVYGQSNITISGLSGASTVDPYIVFFAKDGSTIVTRVHLAVGATGGTVSVPSGAYWVQFTTRAREASTPTYSNIQVEYGTTATGLASYSTPQLLKVFGYDIYRDAPVTYTGQKNLFNAANVTAGYEVYGDGSLQPESTSSASDFIWVDGQPSITVSGLQAAGAFPDVYGAFYALDKTTVIQSGFTWHPGTTTTFSVPLGASWFRFSPKQRNANAANYSAAQVEYGTTATTYAAYEARALTVNGSYVDKNYATSPVSGAVGKSFLSFGDSKTETATLTGTTSSGTYTEGTRENWPKFAKGFLRAGAWKNYATSGASFSYTVSLTTFQYLRNQITRAHNDGTIADIIIVSAGTNDQGNARTLGSYSTAMSKSVGSLDNTVVLEAMRLALIDIRTYWPNAKCFYVTPQQRADFTAVQQQVYIAPMVQMVQTYSCEVFDQNSEIGIVSEFESVSGLPAGRYLRDGLHETVSSDSLPSGISLAGTVLAGRYMARKLSNALMFQ